MCRSLSGNTAENHRNSLSKFPQDLVSHFVLVYAIWSKMASNPAERKLKIILAVIKNVKIISVSTPKLCLGIEKPEGIEKLGVLMCRTANPKLKH